MTALGLISLQQILILKCGPVSELTSNISTMHCTVAVWNILYTVFILNFSSFLSFSIYFCVSFSISLSFFSYFSLSPCPNTFMIYYLFLFLCLCLFLSLPPYLSLSISVCLFVCLSVFLSLSVSLSVFLFILFTHSRSFSLILTTNTHHSIVWVALHTL